MATKKRALGRGLSALLENSSTDITSKINVPESRVAGSISKIELNSIETNPFQPRKQFNSKALSELIDSIKTHGIIQPITVRKMGNDKYQLVSGERRYRASTMAGLKSIPAYIKIVSDQSMLEMALIENIQRENLDPIEIADSYQRLIKECNLTQEDMALRVGKSRVAVTNFLRLLKLPIEVKDGLRKKSVTMGHARALLGLENEKQIIKIYHHIIAKQLSVRKVEYLVNELTNPQQKREKSAPLSFEEKSWLNGLSHDFSTKVSLNRGGKGSGKLIFHFNSADEMEQLIKKLKQ